MTDLVFDDIMQPDLQTVALKGKYMTEFLRCVPERLEYYLAYLKVSDRNHPAFSEMTQFNDKAREWAQAFTKRLQRHFSSREAKEHGIDLKDLITWTDHHSILTTKQIQQSWAKDIPYLARMERLFVKSFLQDFSACLAVQEHREENYYAMIKQYMEHNRKTELHRGAQHFIPQHFTRLISADLLITRHLLDLRKHRRSLVAVFEEAICNGTHRGHHLTDCSSEKLYNETLALTYGLNLAKKSGKIKFERIRKEALREAAEITGIPLSKGLGH